jgi:hypothetical protein
MRRHDSRWQPPPLPDDPAERRKIGIRLVDSGGTRLDRAHHRQDCVVNE